jgi:anti-anti-sigma regulatory factor
VTLHGDLDRSGAAGLHDALDDLINNQGNLRVAVDLRRLRRIDPSCASLFLAASNWARRRGGSFTVHRRRPAVGT